MRFSFIVTAYNIERYIADCLTRLTPHLRKGDQLIVVDDGSTDQTAAVITRTLEQLFGPETASETGGMARARDIALVPIFLEQNTPGGVGIPANIGMEAATGEALFFVDGDDLVDGAGLEAVRSAYEADPVDVLIANYRVFKDGTGNDSTGQLFDPPDQELWALAQAAGSPRARRGHALHMVGVPWRKIYRTGFLRQHRLRFPEGDFFYEDGPFHWLVSLAARDIRFCDRVVCSHRVGRSGQTMAAQGMELAAFFDHFDLIRRHLKRSPWYCWRPRVRRVLLRWLLENMAWHMERLSPAAHWAYALRAQESRARVSVGDWRSLRYDPVALRALGPAWALARGELAAVVAGWQGQAVARVLNEQLDAVHAWTEGQAALQEFHALQALQARFPGGVTGTTADSEPD